jgi:hypothetical protein
MKEQRASCLLRLAVLRMEMTWKKWNPFTCMFAHRFEQLENFIGMVSTNKTLLCLGNFYVICSTMSASFLDMIGIPPIFHYRTCQQQLQLPRHHVSRDPQVGIQVSELP